MPPLTVEVEFEDENCVVVSCSKNGLEFCGVLLRQSEGSCCLDRKRLDDWKRDQEQQPAKVTDDPRPPYGVGCRASYGLGGSAFSEVNRNGSARLRPTSIRCSRCKSFLDNDERVVPSVKALFTTPRSRVLAALPRRPSRAKDVLRKLMPNSIGRPKHDASRQTARRGRNRIRAANARTSGGLSDTRNAGCGPGSLELEQYKLKQPVVCIPNLPVMKISIGTGQQKRTTVIVGSTKATVATDQSTDGAASSPVKITSTPLPAVSIASQMNGHPKLPSPCLQNGPGTSEASTSKATSNFDPSRCQSAIEMEMSTDEDEVPGTSTSASPKIVPVENRCLPTVLKINTRAPRPFATIRVLPFATSPTPFTEGDIFWAPPPAGTRAFWWPSAFVTHIRSPDRAAATEPCVTRRSLSGDRKSVETVMGRSVTVRALVIGSGSDVPWEKVLPFEGAFLKCYDPRNTDERYLDAVADAILAVRSKTRKQFAYLTQLSARCIDVLDEKMAARQPGPRLKRLIIVPPRPSDSRLRAKKPIVVRVEPQVAIDA